MNHPNGKFEYKINLNPRVNVPPRYNELRHAGATYAMAEYHLVQPSPWSCALLTRSAHFLKQACLAAVPTLDEYMAIWSIPELVNRRSNLLQAKLGGSGLGLVALLSVERTCPGQTPMSQLQQLGNFLLYMQKDDGSYYSKYTPSGGGRDDSWTSLYYPGEAALGLIMLYEHDGERQWLNAAINALHYLARIRVERQHVEADHWAVLATAKLQQLSDGLDDAITMELLQHHVVQICESMLWERYPHPSTSLLHGCFTNDGRTTPTATRLEGMLAALSVIPSNAGDLRERILTASTEGIAFLLRAHVSEGPHRGAMPRAVMKLPPDHPAYSRAFNRRATEVRIDYVQHALSAILAYEHIVCGHDAL